MVNILLVEDDQDLNRTVCHYLNAHNYQTKGVLSAQDAFDALYAARYDLILSDIMMPGMDGFVFAEAVRRQDKNIPILFMTARDDFTSKERGFRLGIDDYVVKPVNLDELVLRIEALLRRASAIALCHNHPSGNVRPSADDDRLTERLARAASCMDIRLIDHVVLTDGAYYSYADEGKL